MLFTSLICLGVAVVSVYLSQQLSEDLKYLAILIGIIFGFLSVVFMPIFIKLLILMGFFIKDKRPDFSFNHW